MKATGIVRRIDDLGRVVIPKEIRRTLRIREGDPLEIFTATDGEVVFKKYSPVGELGNFAAQYAEVLTRISQMPTVITDRDHVIAVAGASRREYMERRVTQALENYMEQRRSYTATENSNGDTLPVEGIDSPASIIYPIIASGDVTGAVCMLQSDTVKIPTDAEIKLCQSAAAFLGKQMEE
ncbi:MAG: stage V sporulation T C-terminal domain-containing protein [Ruminococcus sp.]